jgi:Tfp pilus assembly protein PilN
MRAVNLIPADSRGRSSSGAPSTGMQVPAYVLLGFLALAVALVTVYVLTNNTIGARKAKLASLQAQVAQDQAQAARLGEFTKFSQLAQTRIGTVQSIVAKVVPANTTLTSVVGTVVPGATAGGSGGGGTSSLRGDIAAPAFELVGCTANQDQVARLMSQLRLINGVTRVSFSNSQEPNTGSAGGASGGSGSAPGCGVGAATFDLVVFFQPVANAGPTGVTTVSGTPASTTSASSTPASSTSASTTTASSTSTSTTTGGSK